MSDQRSLFDTPGPAAEPAPGGRPAPARPAAVAVTTGHAPLRHLRLDRPLVVFDLETTGIDVARDRIVQLALIRVEPDGTRRLLETLVDPEQPIPAASTAIHGIGDEDVRGQPTLAELVPLLHELLAGADLAGFNSIAFDLPLLVQELHRVGSPLDLGDARHLDAMVIFKRMEQRNLSAALRFYCGRDLEGAHAALADAEAALDVLDAQAGHYDELPRDAEGLHAFCNERAARYVDATRKFGWDEDGEAVLAFGKLNGRRLRDVACEPDGRGFLQWMLGRDFTAEVKQIVQLALDGTYPRRR
ncbi:MAG: 3'-5' exonuclease [Candidatus Krumholzibacteriia bacterium]